MSQQQQPQPQPERPAKSGISGARSAFLAKLPLILRVAELCLTIIVLGLVIDPINARLQHNVNHSALTYVTYAGYILINCVLIISEVTGEPLPKTACLLFAFIGGVLFVATGSLLIHDWRTLNYSMHYHPPKMYMDMMISSGIIGIFTACLFFADVVITVRYA
ncbi:uncharacterized protein LOC113204321 isoform X2 [Frankliniella occidentalis]|nr:uncharacterized protein LOC113204321 isoform X2 [Frankliniella occidentalis]